MRTPRHVGFFTGQLEWPYNMAAGLPHSERRETRSRRLKLHSFCEPDLFFFLDLFIYLFMIDREREREREAETQEEGEAGSMPGARRGT